MGRKCVQIACEKDTALPGMCDTLHIVTSLSRKTGGLAMNDPRQPLPGSTPRPAGIPQQHPVHPTQPQHATHPQHSQSLQPGGPRPVMRPAVAPAQHPQPAHPTGPAKIAPMPTLKAGIPAEDDGAIALIEDGEEAEV